MGENKHIKELDAFAKKYVKEIPQEKPGVDFTASLMNKITQENRAEVFKVNPLISKKGWALIFASILAVIFIPLKSSQESFINLPQLNVDFFDKIQFANLFDLISVSTITLYAIVFFGLLFFVQLVFLKKHFDKRIY